MRGGERDRERERERMRERMRELGSEREGGGVEIEQWRGSDIVRGRQS